MASSKKVLELKFDTMDNKQTTLSFANAKESMSKEEVRGVMQEMVDSGAFATSKNVAYKAPHSAAYVERTITSLFESKDA